MGSHNWTCKIFRDCYTNSLYKLDGRLHSVLFLEHVWLQITIGLWMKALSSLEFFRSCFSDLIERESLVSPNKLRIGDILNVDSNWPTFLSTLFNWFEITQDIFIGVLSGYEQSQKFVLIWFFLCQLLDDAWPVSYTHLTLPTILLV